MPKLTFQPVTVKGKRLAQGVEYTALLYTAGTVTHRLALHRSSIGVHPSFPRSSLSWQVSDPISGGLILRDVGAWVKGCPVSSAGLTLAGARMNAMASLDALLERIGSDAFNARLAAAAQGAQA